ncbi:MAG: hypothetical protein ACRENX_03550 [Candidatus Dormibacteria bacterium]
MDPDDRLIEELAAQLHRATAEMRLHPETRRLLKQQLLATPRSRWRARLRSWPSLSRTRGALAGVAVAAIAAAVVIPLATANHTPNTTERQYLAVLPPGVNGGHAAAAAPMTCHGAVVHLVSSPTRANLTPGQRRTFVVSVTGSTCPLSARVAGPVAAGLSIESEPKPSSSPGGAPSAVYDVIWSGRGPISANGNGAAGSIGALEPRKLVPGTYQITLSVPPSGARAYISISISS